MPVRKALWHYFVEHHLHIVSHIGIPTLVERKARRSVHYCKKNPSISWCLNILFLMFHTTRYMLHLMPTFYNTCNAVWIIVIRKSRENKCRANVTVGGGAARRQVLTLLTLDVAEPHRELRQLGNLLQDLLSDQVHAPVLRPQVQLPLKPRGSDLNPSVRGHI